MGIVISIFMKSNVPLTTQGLILAPVPSDAEIMVSSLVLPNNKKIWRTGRILNQGQASSCGGYSATQNLMSDPRRKNIPDPDKTATDIYRLAQKLDEYPGEEPEYYGTTLTGVVKAMQSMNLITNKVIWITSVPSLITALQVGTVVVGTNWYWNMAVTSKGRMAVKGSNLGGHAWLVNGYDAPNKLLYGTNSHGRNYGTGGKMTISFDDMTILFKEGGSGCLLEKA
jgi:hypothetical protein